MPQIIKQMEEAGVHKIITVGTAGILQARTIQIYIVSNQRNQKENDNSSRRSFGCI